MRSSNTLRRPLPCGTAAACAGRHPPRAAPARLAPVSRCRPIVTAATPPAGAAPTPHPPSLLSTLAATASTYFLPLALVGGVAAGILAPAAGAALASAGGALASTGGVFFVAGLGMDPAAVARAARSTRDVVCGLASILVLSPLLAGPIAARLPLHPPDLAVGLAVFMCVPTTLSSGVALTAAAGGDAALALVLTLASNVLGVVTTPLAVAAVLGGGVAGGLDPAPLLETLASAVAAPLAAGAALRAAVPGLASWATAHKKLLSRTSAILLAAVPWMQVSRAVGAGVPLPPAQLAAAAVAGVALHCLLLVLNYVAFSFLRPGPDAAGARCALVVCASQKTLPVAVTVLASAAGGASAGVAAAPIVAVHLAQIVIDGVVAQV